ncbi:acyl-CoA dehydrogenase family protein, partial [Streptomyces sp. NPDC005568]|uniref:acyl-CoA dehydrogenase family protein n=1 Tax=Streptomyces sp. NPDC005568 TaxID=3156887 RepID=UPI0033A1E24A
MHFQLTDDQQALRAGVRTLLEGRFGRGALRAAVDGGGLDRALWHELGAAGFFALRLPEAEGGVGLGLPEAVLAFEEAPTQAPSRHPSPRAPTAVTRHR